MSKQRHATVTVYKSRRGWRYRIMAANGERIGASQAYASKANAIRGAQRNNPFLQVFVTAAT